MTTKNFKRRDVLRTLIAGLFAAPLGHGAAQEAYPNRPLKIFMGVPPGGSADLAMRPFANMLGQRLSQQVLLDHRPGANQSIAVNAAAKATPDGYSLVMASDAAMSLALSLPTPLPYNVKEDLVPIGIVTYITQILVTQPGNRITTLADLIARARAEPGKISYGSLGIGSSSHIAMEAFSQIHGIELLHVPFSGTAPATVAVLGGQVDMVLVSIGNTLPYLPQRLRGIAVAGAERSPLLPNVPTFLESGVKDFVVRGWLGLFAPRRTPETAVALLRRETWNIVSSRAFIDSAVLPNASEPSTVPPERLTGFLAADQQRWADWVKRLGTRLKLS